MTTHPSGGTPRYPWFGIALLTSAVAIASVVVGVPARAAFPGANGRLVFQSARSGNYEIYSMNPDGSGLENLTNSPGDEVTPAWSADGTRIAFARDEIYVMNADGSNATQLTFGTGFAFPAWSPDGTRVAYLGDDNDIHIVDASGNGSDVNVTNSTEWERPPSWSPDGTRIAFGRYDPAAAQPDDDIWLMDPDGTDQVQITSTAGFDGAPDWSPDGTKIAFCGNAASLDIMVMDADGTDRVNLTSSPGTDECWPRWSPNGSQIVFHDYGPGPTFNLDIFVMQADGSGVVDLASDPADDRNPSWQPRPNRPVSGGSSPTPPPSTFDLAASRQGRGRIVSSPQGINCGKSCSASFVDGTSVTLTARPHANWEFKRWRYGCRGQGESCTLEISSNRRAEAVFVKA